MERRAGIFIRYGALLTISFADEIELFDWEVEDSVMVVDGTDFRRHVINLRTGQEVWIP